VEAYSDGISFVDRDMIIRNLPNLGLGHVYGFSVATETHTATCGTLAPDIPEGTSEDVVMSGESQVIEETMVHEGDSLEVEDPELGLEDREADNLDEEEHSGQDSLLSDEDVLTNALEDNMDDCCE